MIKSDFHLHSNFSSDSTASMESMIQQAIQLNLSEICFTEHLDIDYPENAEGLDFLLDLPAYQSSLFSLKEKYKSNIKILCGIELGLTPTTYEKNKAFIHGEFFDFIIGSTHIVHNMDPYEPEYFLEYPGKEGMKEYFLSILYNLDKFSDFDVYGHLDYVIRYCKDKNFTFRYLDYSDILDEILKKIIDLGKGIEANSAGYKHGLGRPNPHPDILKRYHELGGEILTIGSDAHKPSHMAYDFKELPALLTSLGFRYYTIFEKRKPKFIKL